MCMVSVIIPYYNNEETIIRALESVKNQTFKDIEVITIDDGSSDNSFNIVEEWKKNNCINFRNFTQKNGGPSVARNKGIELAQGKYIAFLDADDSWEIKKIEKQVNILEENEEIGIIGCDHYVKEDKRILTRSTNSKELRKITFNEKLLKNQFCTPSVVIRRSILIESNIRFSENQRYAEDTLFYLQILRRYNGVKIEEPLVNLYKAEISNKGLSSKLWETEKCELKNFKILYKENSIDDINKISFIKLNGLFAFSLIKFGRRVIKKYI